jgi:hypothetical protein
MVAASVLLLFVSMRNIKISPLYFSDPSAPTIDPP